MRIAQQIQGRPELPAMFVGAAGDIVFSRVPGLTLVAGFAMGIGAMSAAMLRLPPVSVLLATLLIGSQGLTVVPLVIVAVVARTSRRRSSHLHLPRARNRSQAGSGS